jgi:hypothetical protein
MRNVFVPIILGLILVTLASKSFADLIDGDAKLTCKVLGISPDGTQAVVRFTGLAAIAVFLSTGSITRQVDCKRLWRSAETKGPSDSLNAIVSADGGLAARGSDVDGHLAPTSHTGDTNATF